MSGGCGKKRYIAESSGVQGLVRPRRPSQMERDEPQEVVPLKVLIRVVFCEMDLYFLTKTFKLFVPIMTQLQMVVLGSICRETAIKIVWFKGK